MSIKKMYLSLYLCDKNKKFLTIKTIYLSFAFIAILFSNDLKAAYEDDYQARADSLYERVASMSESDFSWAPEHVMAKIIAHYELGETATADDLIEFGSGGTTYPEKEPFHFTYYSSVRVLYLYPNATGVRNSKQTYVQSVWDRQDSYNI